MTPLLKSKRNQGGAVTPHAVRRQRKRGGGPSQTKTKAKRVKTQKQEKLAPVELPDDFDETQGEQAILVTQIEPLVMQEVGAYFFKGRDKGFELLLVFG